MILIKKPYIRNYKLFKKGEYMTNNLEKMTKWGADNLTGIIAIIAGLILLSITYKIIISLITFILGMSLVYFGLARLKITVVTDFLDNVMNKIKTFFSQ